MTTAAATILDNPWLIFAVASILAMVGGVLAALHERQERPRRYEGRHRPNAARTPIGLVRAVTGHPRARGPERHYSHYNGVS